MHMGVKRFFDGNVLTEVFIPDQPLPNFNGDGTTVHNQLITPQNPTGIDPTTLRVDAASLDNLKPTDGAAAMTPKFPDPLPGSGEGAGVGQRSTTTGVFADPWNNNPLKEPNELESLQSGEVGSALPPQVAAAAAVTNAKLDAAAPAATVQADDVSAMTKPQLIDYITAAGETPVEGNKPELQAQAQTIANAKAQGVNDLA